MFLHYIWEGVYTCIYLFPYFLTFQIVIYLLPIKAQTSHQRTNAKGARITLIYILEKCKMSSNNSDLNSRKKTINQYLIINIYSLSVTGILVTHTSNELVYYINTFLTKHELTFVAEWFCCWMIMIYML